MTIALVQNKGIKSSGTSVSATITSTTGNTLVVYVSAYVSGSTPLSIVSVSDTASNSWNYSTATSNQNPPANGSYNGFYAFTAIGYCVSANSVTSVTVTLNQNCGTFYVGVTEFSGLGTNATVDASASNAPLTSTGTFTTPAITNTGTADAVVAVLACDTGQFTAASPAFVQQVGSFPANSGSSTTIVIPVTATTTVGNTVIAWFRIQSGSGTVSSIVDSKSNTWTIDADEFAAADPVAVGSSILTTALVSGDTITLTISGARAFRAGGAAEFAGPLASGGTTVKDILNATTWTDPAATTAVPTSAASVAASELIFTYAGSSGTQTITPTTSDPNSGGTWVALSSPATSYVQAAYQIASATSTFKCTWTVSSGTTGAGIISYKAVPAYTTIQIGSTSSGALAASYITSAAGLTKCTFTGPSQTVEASAILSLTTTGGTTLSRTVANTVTASITATPTVLPPAGGASITQTVTGNVQNDYGLDNVPFTLTNTGDMLVAFISWNIAFYPYQSTGKAPAVNVTDSNGNLWKQVGISGQSSGSRSAIWVCYAAQPVTWVSVAITGWAYSTAYSISEITGVPAGMVACSIDFIQSSFNGGQVTSLTVPSGTATVADMAFAVLGIGRQISGPSTPAGWTQIAVAGNQSTFDSATVAYWIASQSAGTVAFAPSWTTSAPASGVIVGLKRTAAAPVSTNPNFPLVVVEAAFGANPGDWTQSVDYTYSIEGITWTDITTRIRTTDRDAITISRGRQYELSQEETGEIHIMVDNHDGVFTFGNTASPYYPFVVPGVPIRVTAWWQGIQYPLAFGYVERWPQSWPEMPQWGFSEIVATDAFGPLASTTLSSAVEGEIRKDYPYAYFPTDEQYSFTTQSLSPIKAPIDASGLIAVNKAFGNNRFGAYRDGFNQPIQVGQALNLLGDSDTTMGASSYTAQDSNDNGPGLFYSDPNIPTNASFSFTVSGTPAANNYFIITTGQNAANSISVGDTFTASNNGSTQFQVTGISAPSAGFVNVFFSPNAGTTISNPATVTQNSAAFSVEFWFVWGAGTSFKCTLFNAFGPPSTYMQSVNPTVGGVMTVGINTGTGQGLFFNNTLIASATTTPAFNQTTFAPQHFVVACSPANGTTCYLNGQATSVKPANLPTIQQIRAMVLGASRYSYDNSFMIVYDAYNFVAGHLAIYGQEITPTMISNHYQAGINGSVGDSPPRRFSKVLTWGLLGLKRGGPVWYASYGNPENTAISEAYSYEGSTGADVIGQITLTEGGRCFTTANGSLIYMQRWNFYNQPVAQTFGDNGTTEIPFEQSTSFDVDNTNLFNQINSVQQRGPNSDIFYQQTNFPSQLSFFVRSGLQFQSFALSPFDVYSRVNWSMAKYNNPIQRVAQLDLNVAATNAKANSFTAVLRLDLQDMVTINRRPVGAGTGGVMSITGPIQRIQHSIGAATWKTSYQVAPQFPEGQALVADIGGQNTLGTQYLSW